MGVRWRHDATALPGHVGTHNVRAAIEVKLSKTTPSGAILKTLTMGLADLFRGHLGIGGEGVQMQLSIVERDGTVHSSRIFLAKEDEHGNPAIVDEHGSPAVVEKPDRPAEAPGEPLPEHAEDDPLGKGR